MIHILHLCSYYTGSTVYRDLIRQLSQDDRVGEQFVFSPIRKESQKEANQIRSRHVTIQYVYCLNLLTRLSFFLKQIRLWRAFRASPEASNALMKASVIHAHTLYADGVLAYLFYRLYEKPYVVTVRGTDVNLGDRFFVIWRPLAKAILRNANRVFFVSPAHLTLAKRRYPKLLAHAAVVPNGLDDFWLENAVSRKNSNSNNDRVRGLFIGSINRNKNLKSALEAFHRAAKGRPYSFEVIGGSYKEFVARFGALRGGILDNVEFRGLITDKAVIKHSLENANIFVMPSFSETFGLVYLEAISQATPVVYSLGQGIDGYFRPGETGFPCDPGDVSSITSAIEKTLEKFPAGLRYPDVDKNPARHFSWSHAADTILRSGYQADVIN